MRDLELARYQTALLEELARDGVTDEARVRSLRARAEIAPFASYVEEMESTSPLWTVGRHPAGVAVMLTSQDTSPAGSK